MEQLAIARAVHVLAVVIWIGGVWMVTTIVLPQAVRSPQGHRLAEAVEQRFSWHARIAALAVGASGFYMIAYADLWDRFSHPGYWWMHAMVAVWAVFSIILFVAEPLFLHRWFSAQAARKPRETLLLVQRAHWMLLAVSVVTIIGAVAGSHGF